MSVYSVTCYPYSHSPSDRASLGVIRKGVAGWAHCKTNLNIKYEWRTGDATKTSLTEVSIAAGLGYQIILVKMSAGVHYQNSRDNDAKR